MQNTKPIKFKSISSPRKRLFFTIEDETLNNFYALIHAVDFLNKNDGRYDISLAFKNPNLVSLANNVGWLGFKPSLLKDVSNTRVISLSPSQDKIEYWQKTDREDEFDYRVVKYPSIDPEKLAVPEIRYNNYIAILRDVIEIFDIKLDHPLAFLTEAKNVKYFTSSKLQQSSWDLLQRNNIKSGAFTLVETGFSNWNNSQDSVIWGRVISVPKPEDLLTNEKSLLEYVGTFYSSNCAGIGLISTDYVALGVSSYRTGTSVIWDLRPSLSVPNEDAETRLLSSLLVPESKNVIAPNIDPESIPQPVITRELAYVLSVYYNEFKKVISQGKSKGRLDRPIVPPEFTWSLA